jgi:hypothetical protein
MKKLLLILLSIFFFYCQNFSLAVTKPTTMPVEIANPDKILMENTKTTFYIIINDANIRKNVIKLEVSFL